MSADAVVPRLLTVGLHRNSHRSEWNLPEVEASVRGVATAAALYGFHHEDWSEPGTTAALRDRLVGLAEPVDGPQSSGTLLYWCGHGQLTDREFFLITNDASSASALGGALSARDLGRLLSEEEKHRLTSPDPGWRIIIVDTCDSGIGIAEMAEEFPNASPRGTLLIASAAQGAAGAGDFGSYLASVFEKEFINQTDPIPVREVRRRIEDWLRDSNLIRGSVDWDATIPAPTTVDSTITTSMDLLQELHSLPKDALAHFLPHGPSPALARFTKMTTLPWQFFGRMTERTRIAQWLRDESGLLAVVGAAGSGKTALLGMVLASTVADLVKELRRRRPETWPQDVVPAGLHFDVVSQLSHKSLQEFVEELCATFPVEPTTDLDAIIDQMADRDITPVVLVDALDEALDAPAIAGALTKLASLNGAKILVGTSPTLTPPASSPIVLPPVQLLPLLGNPSRIDIATDPGAAEGFVADQLAGLPEEHARAWASEVASREEPFLFARLAVHEALSNPSEDPRALPGEGVDGLFARAWDRICLTNPPTAHLLRALAQSCGRGFPRNDGVWALAASALSDTPVNDPDVGAALQQAAPYILVDHEFGQAAFRLADREFLEHFRSQTWFTDDTRAVAKRLLQLLRSDESVPAYLRTYLYAHVSAANLWAEITQRDLDRMGTTHPGVPLPHLVTPPSKGEL